MGVEWRWSSAVLLCLCILDGTVVESSKDPKSVSVLHCQLAVIVNDLLSGYTNCALRYRKFVFLLYFLHIDWFVSHGVEQAFLPVRTSQSSQSELTDITDVQYETQVCVSDFYCFVHLW